VRGVRTFFGISFRCRAAVLTTGTFMNGRIWVGRMSMPAGRCDAVFLKANSVPESHLWRAFLPLEVYVAALLCLRGVSSLVVTLVGLQQ
jgi:hypothetical protein